MMFFKAALVTKLQLGHALARKLCFLITVRVLPAASHAHSAPPS
jgi:hypothetical protein